MSQYDRFYHLHIPKTAGSYFSAYLREYVYPSFKKNRISYEFYGHHGWYEIKDSTYIVSTIREPIERTASHFSFFLNTSNNPEKFGLKKEDVYDINISIEDRNNPTTKDFMNWFEYNKNRLSNFQSKNFFFYNKDIEMAWTPLIDNQDFKDIIDINLNDLFDKARRVNALMRVDQINHSNMRRMAYEALSAFGIGIDTRYQPNAALLANKQNTSPFTTGILEKLTISEKEYISSFNKIDLELYYNDSLYWNSGKV